MSCRGKPKGTSKQACDGMMLIPARYPGYACLNPSSESYLPALSISQLMV